MPKEFLTYQQQMEKLRSSGLTIEDEEACFRVLADIGYFPVVNGYQSFNMSRTLSRGNEGPSQENLSRLGPFYHHPMISSDRLCHQTDARIRSLIFAG